MKKLIVVLSAVMLFTQCRKEDIQPTASPGMAAPGTGCKQTSENPYNFIGELHNEILDRIKDTPGFPNVSPQQKYAIAIEMVDHRFGELGREHKPFLDFNAAYAERNALMATAGDPGAIINGLFNDGKVTTKQRDAYQHILNVMQNANTQEQRMNMLVAYENAAINRNDISEGEKRMILSTISVAKSSSSYWHDPNNGWPPPVQYSTGGPIIRSIIDVLGFITGCVACGGPVDPPGCIGCGAAFGSFVSSLI